jgi:hypothetical protein
MGAPCLWPREAGFACDQRIRKLAPVRVRPDGRTGGLCYFFLCAVQTASIRAPWARHVYRNCLEKEKSSVRSDMSSTRAAPTELPFEGALDAIDGPRLWRSEASKLTHDQTFESATAPSPRTSQYIPLGECVRAKLSLDKRPSKPSNTPYSGFFSFWNDICYH